MIVDAHLHVWQSDPGYPNQAATTLAPASNVPVELLNQYMDEHDVDRAVLVQPMYPGEDNSYIADCAAADPDRLKAVCVVDPRIAGAADRLRYWVQERGCKGLRLRPRVPQEEKCFGDTATYPLWEYAQSLGIAINVLGNAEHLGTIGRLAEQFSETDILIDHIAHPDVSRGVDSPMFQSLLNLARHPRVYVKISGQPYFSQAGYPYDDCVAFVRAIHDRFGASRMIWGSDFPHILLQSGYRRARLWIERACPFLSHTDRESIMGGNAARLYW